ncbi:hypothetical protein LCGC14_2450450, partial [marine sediment metagenome]
RGAEPISKWRTRVSTNYLAVISCTHCGEMIITKPDGSIFCACTTKRSCKHPEGMDNCHECTIARLQARVEEAMRTVNYLNGGAGAPVPWLPVEVKE